VAAQTSAKQTGLVLTALGERNRYAVVQRRCVALRVLALAL